MPDQEKYQYLLDISSLRLYGRNFLQEVYIFTGEGANGKSVWMTLLEKALGQYFVKFNADTFTNESRGCNQTSELGRADGCRAGVFEEPDDKKTLIVNRFKELSGNSSIRTRALYGESFSFVPQFALIGIMNDMPKLSKVEYAMDRRLRVLSWDCKFVAKPILPHHRQKDDMLGPKIENDTNYALAFITILINNWINSDLLTEKLHTPQDVYDKSKEYMDSSNTVKDFLEEYYIQDPDINAKIKSSDLFNMYNLKNRDKDARMTKDAFKSAVVAQGYFWKREMTGRFFCYIKEKPKDFVND